MNKLTIALGAAAAASMCMAASGPTYTKDVAPIVFENCATCHRPGDIGPMPLLSYEQVRPWAKSIRDVVATGKMPPWQSVDPHGTFSNDRRLTEQQKETLLNWVDAGAPQGDVKDMPPVPKFPEGWNIGKPDVVLSMARPFAVPASGTVQYQYFQIPTHFTEDKWVQAIEVRPGARAVVHHVLVFARAPHEKMGSPAFTPILPKMPGRGGRSAETPPPNFEAGLIATTAPGTNGMVFAPGQAMLIKAGSMLTFQIHYTTNGKAAEDISSVGMVFAKEPPREEVHTSAFINAFFTLPAGEPNQEVDSEIEFNQDSHITALFPHTHLRGKSWEYRMTYPDGTSEVVLSVPKYDFNWQTYYFFANAAGRAKGSKLLAIAHYDNSVNNPSNPDPTKAVHWGNQTWEEMQYTGINYTVDEQPLPAPSAPTGAAQQQQ